MRTRTLRTICRLLVGVVAFAAPSLAAVEPCVGGMAGIFPCSNVNVLAHLTETDLGITAATDNWGWTDPSTGVEYALVCAVEGIVFVDLSDPEAPFVVGTLPAHNGLTTGIRDVKVYADHAFVVAGTSGHGMQVFDLTELRGVATPPVTFSETAHYTGISDSHNIAINEATGFAYSIAGSTCSQGLDMIDVSNPLVPTFAGCFSSRGQIHDAQCVVYTGPDTDHQGLEICFSADPGSPNALTIVDVSVKANPVGLSTTTYPNTGYPHQGWLTDDHSFFVLGDELDEGTVTNTRTIVFDVRDLDLPVVAGEYSATTESVDHNGYVRGRFVYQANYRAGFRVLEIADAATGQLQEVGFLDTHPTNDLPEFVGAWSTYPFFDSGIVIGTDTREGLFVLDTGMDLFSDGFESGDTTRWSTVVP